MARRNRRNRNSNDLTIAQAEGDVRYGPQVTQIRDLYQQAAGQRVSDINAARQNARSAIAFAQASRPEVNAVYKRGANVENVAAREVQQAFAPLSAGADPYRAAAARETQGAKTRMAEARAAARQELVDRATSAKSGQGFAINQATQEYGSSKRTLDQKLQDILGQRGTYISGRLATLANQRAAERLKLNLANMSDKTKRDIAAAQIQATAEEGAANRKAKNKPGSGGGGGGDRQTPSQRTSLSNEFQKALSFAKQYANDPGQGATAHERRANAAEALLRGQRGEAGKTADIPSFGQLPLTLALDMAFDGHISRAHAQRLHGLNVKVSDLSGARSYGDWLKTPAGRAWRRGQRRGPVTPATPVGVFAPGQIGGMPGGMR